MATIKALFPLSFKVSTLKDLLISIVVYLVADLICGLVIGFLGGIPLIGLVLSIIGWVLGVYFFVGIVIAVLAYLDVLK